MLSQKKTNCYPCTNQPHLKNVMTLSCKMQNFLIWLKVMLRSTTLCWNSAHVATRRFQNSSVSWIGKLTRYAYTRSCESYSIQTRLYQAHLHWACSKNQRQYYRDVLLTQKLLPAIHSIAGDMFVFQQDNAPAHRAHDRVQLLRRETPQFISPDMWPANSRDLSPVDYRVWGMLQQRVSSSSPRHRRVVEASCCDMGWISAQHDGRCSW